jgi:HD superfamily phosphohydrolase
MNIFIRVFVLKPEESICAFPPYPQIILHSYLLDFGPKTNWLCQIMPLTDFPKVVEIKDPLHGYVALSEVEKAVTDLRLTQRLRTIRSPAGVYMVFSGADTSLMGKLLGFMHTTHIFMDYLGASKEEIQNARLAAMFLTLSTGPWENVINEFLTVRGLNRRQLAELIIKESPAGETLEDFGYSPDEVANTINRGVPLKGVHFDLETSPINPELVDRLERDSYFSGVEYAQLEFRRLFQSTRVAKNKIAIERGALFTFESYLSAGANMFDAVYYHKSVRAAELMLLRILDEAGAELAPSPRDDLNAFLGLDDISFMDQLLNPPEDASEEMQTACKLFEDYSARYLIKMASERAISDVAFLDSISTPDGLFNIEKEIADNAGIDPSNVFVDYPDRQSVSFYPGKFDIEDLVFFERGSKGYEFWPVEDISLLARSFERKIKLVRVYTTRGYRSKVKKAADALLESIDAPGSTE